MTTTTSTSPPSCADAAAGATAALPRPPVWTVATRVGVVSVVQSQRTDGDFHLDHVSAERLRVRRHRLVPRPWAMLDEVHGVAVVTVEDPAAADRRRGDVAICDRDDIVVGVWTGDCAPIVLVAPDGRFAVVHAGWRGIAAGVVDVAVDAVAPGRSAGVRAHLGPVIGPCCYEFGAADLVRVAAAVGVPPDAIAARTTVGTPALDVPAVIGAALDRHGIELDGPRLHPCTRCDGRFFSHRGGDRGRHVTAVWRSRA